MHPILTHILSSWLTESGFRKKWCHSIQWFFCTSVLHSLITPLLKLLPLQPADLSEPRAGVTIFPETHLRIEADLADIARDNGALGLGYRYPEGVVDHCLLHRVHLPGKGRKKQSLWSVIIAAAHKFLNHWSNRRPSHMTLSPWWQSEFSGTSAHARWLYECYHPSLNPAQLNILTTQFWRDLQLVSEGNLDWVVALASSWSFQPSFTCLEVGRS